MSNTTYNPGTDYKLVWADEFDGEKLNPENWNRQVEEAGRFNKEWQRYTDSEENAFIEDGKLVIQAIHVGDEHAPNQYTSARLNTAHKQFWKYGKIVSRMKLPRGNGIWPAFWTLGNNIDENGGDTLWPWCGEIDVWEMYGSIDNGEVKANFHYADENDQHDQMGEVEFNLPAGEEFHDDFHIFELEWTEEEFIWSIDGQEYHRQSIAHEKYQEAFHHEHFILLNIAVGGGYAGKPDDSTGFPQRMVIDWVRVYQKG